MVEIESRLEMDSEVVIGLSSFNRQRISSLHIQNKTLINVSKTRDIVG